MSKLTSFVLTFLLGRPLNVTGKKYKGNNNKCEAGKKRKNSNIFFNEQKEEIIFYGEQEGKFKPISQYSS